MRLGKHKLTVKKVLKKEVYLTNGSEDIKLKEIDSSLEVGQEVEVFVYDAAKDRRVAIRNNNIMQVGEVAKVKIVDKTKFGYFVYIGLDKDIFLPFQEVVGRVEVGEKYLMTLYIDKSDRLCVTMKIRDKLSPNRKFKVNDLVKGTIYDIDSYGAYVAIYNRYDGMIPKSEIKGVYRVGDEVEARIQRILKNNKITLTIREKAYKQMHSDADMLLEMLEENEGVLNIGDKSDPDLIKDITGLTKSSFKRAEGALYKDKKVDLYPEKIVLKRK